MKRLLLLLPLVSTTIATSEPLQCDVGPVNKTFAAVKWLVYSCRDNKSVVIVSAPGNPAAPFYFMFTPEGSGYKLVGEGAGAKDITDRALAELKALRVADVEALIHETQTPPR
jgi:hypothetical protein